MNFKSLVIATSVLLNPQLFSENGKELIIDLKDPHYSKGVICTDKGGVITTSGLRIQAEKITYTHTETSHCVYASGDLMMEYEGRFFVGETLSFDLIKKTGYLTCGRANVDGWYIGGEHIDLAEDGSFTIFGAYVTTCVGQNNPWEIRIKTGKISDNILLARDVRFQVMKFPLLWLPGYKTNLGRLTDSPIRYRLLWDTGLGPRLSMRYRFYSNETVNAFVRFDYRILRGPGGALELEYHSRDTLTHFQSRNYGALDKNFPNQVGDVNYRFQGIFKTRSEDEYTRFHVQWDRLSSNRMIGDFRDNSFELNTQKATYLEFSHYRPSCFFNATVRPKINSFQTLNEELPYGVLGIHPFEIFNSGIIMENYASGSYFDYVYANQLEPILMREKAGRLETINNLYRPFSVKALTVTPHAGLVGIYYSKNPNCNSIGQFLFTYGADTNLRMSKDFSTLQHTIIPYAKYLGYSRPRVSVDNYFVFDIHDGYDKIDQLRFGVRQLLFSKKSSVFLPTMTLDLYSYAFWGAESFTQTLPKAFADLTINQPSYAIKGSMGWNFQENLLDYGNAELLWTISSTFAFGVEFRHRSAFWWRKAIYDNFVVDFARPIDELLDSSMSDRRNTFLAKAHLRLTPRLTMHLQTHHGWDRKDEPPYHGAKVDFTTMLPGQWQMKLTYEYLPNDPFRMSYSFRLLK